MNLRASFERFDLDAMRERLAEYISGIGVELRKRGTRYVGLCPVHADSSPSFSLFGPRLDACGCFPCGFSGDIFQVSRWLGRSTSFPEAVRDVRAVLGIALRDGGTPAPARPAPVPVERKPVAESPKRIHWPRPPFHGSPRSLETLSAARGISVPGLNAAQEAGVLRFCRIAGADCYVVTDHARRAAEIRRVDGSLFHGTLKAYPLAGVDKTWLPGADRLRHASPDAAVLLVEGATDLLTAYQLLLHHHHRAATAAARPPGWVPIALLGAGCRKLHPDCARLLHGRQVRLVPDGDAAGDSMADHWTRALRDLRCTVDIARLPRGKDLTDIAAELAPGELFA